MKDQYFGDFGDYQKVSLLKSLQNEGLSVLVHWMRTKDDESTDGKHIAYLEKPEIWRSFDADVFDFLRSKVADGKRTLSHIEKSNLCDKIRFLDDHIEDVKKRAELLDNLLSSDSEVVLFDPDNGIEVASTNKKNIHKYVTWNEIIRAFDSGKSVIIYQHFSRTNRENFIRDKMGDIQKRLSCTVLSVRVRHSVYFFLMQKRHETKLRKVIREFSRTWKQLAIVR